MNIDELTIGEARQLMAMFGAAGTLAPATPHPFVGRYCIVRCGGASLVRGLGGLA